MSKNELIAVPFYGDIIHAILREDGMPMIPIPRICENIGIDDRPQRKRIERDTILSEGGSIMDLPSNGGIQKTLCLPLNLIPGWLFGIGTNQIADKRARDKILVYKRECHATLYQRFFGQHGKLEVAEILQKYAELSNELAAIRAQLENGVPLNEKGKREVGGTVVGIIEKRVPPIVDEKLHGVYRPPGYITINELCREHHCQPERPRETLT